MAVDIRLFNTPDETARCNKGQILACIDIERNQCCYAPGLGFQQALFDGLPTEKFPAQGVVFEQGMSDDGCGSAVASGYGLNLCLTTPGDGAEWFYEDPPPGKARRDISECDPVNPSELRIGSRSFDVFYETPEDITNQMVQFWANNTEGTERDIPESFLPYERF